MSQANGSQYQTFDSHLNLNVSLGPGSPGTSLLTPLYVSTSVGGSVSSVPQVPNGSMYETYDSKLNLNVNLGNGAIGTTSGNPLYVSGISGLAPRQQVIYTTASIANNAISTGTVTMAKSFALLYLTTSFGCRVELYKNAADLAADASRPIGTNPATATGVIFDGVTTNGSPSLDVSPQPVGSNTEATPSSAISIAVTNMSGGTNVIAVTLTYLQLEA